MTWVAVPHRPRNHPHRQCSDGADTAASEWRARRHPPETTMSDCCTESGCRRSQPILIRQSGLTGRWYAITRWKHSPTESAPDRIEALDKHEIVIDLVVAGSAAPTGDDDE